MSAIAAIILAAGLTAIAGVVILFAQMFYRGLKIQGDRCVERDNDPGRPPPEVRILVLPRGSTRAGPFGSGG